MGAESGVGAQFGQDAGELGAIDFDVVRPLERDAGHAEDGERTDQRHADRERQATEVRPERQAADADREQHAAAERREPRATTPAPSTGLEFSEQHVGAPRGRHAPAEEFGVGRSDDRLHGEGSQPVAYRRRQRGVDIGCRETRHRRGQLVTAAAHHPDRHTPGVQRAQFHGHDSRPAAERVGQALAGMDRPVGQQVEHAERPAHGRRPGRTKRRARLSVPARRRTRLARCVKTVSSAANSPNEKSATKRTPDGP